ncbi:hypothetical protein S7711_02603 [Stachybotrys chartarum IBT 7711]|uniref:MARVEL domain-containing protein n=1 Tax=Stachybotrys chartarum (strain CBS 109288 / IBT 7711) TaxID=1280523 RepID=A0A084B8Y0_STACB|nr:hypothetical protein S7711_02603 [Stachybotrys chartarum IBT 7711]
MASTVEKGPKDHILQTPIWIKVIRGFQFLLAIIILALTARIVQGAYWDEPGLALATSILTWVIVAYALLTEMVAILHQGYHIFAVLALDGFMMILWLATFAAVAANRAQFRYSVSVSQCYDDGGLIDAVTCFRKRQENVILFESGQDMYSAVAGLGALVWLLFITTFAWTLVNYLRGRKEGRFPFTTASTTTPSTTENAYQMEPKVEQQPAGGPVQPQYPQSQYSEQYQGPPQEHYPQGQHLSQYSYQHSVSPQQQQGPYPPPPQPYAPAEGQQQYTQYPPQPYQQTSHTHTTSESHVVSPMQSQDLSHLSHQSELMGPEHGAAHTTASAAKTPSKPPRRTKRPALAAAWTSALAIVKYQSMAAMAAKAPDAASNGLSMPSPNPLPLSASQEAQVRDVYHARVRRICAEEIKAFAACAVGRTFTVAFACKDQHRAMNNCMKVHATREEHDAARQEWFSMRQERQRKREQKARMAAAQEEFMREWWDLPEDVRLSRKKSMEEQRREERIGGMPAANRPHIGESKER